MTAIDIELYSDTQSLPTAGMRKAMAEAELGDEQKGEDPSTNRLCEMAAELLGKESAVFLPSGTMCNQIAILVHCRPGDEIICDRTSHIWNSECGGPAALAGVLLNPMGGDRGIFTADQAQVAIRPPQRRHSPRTRMIEVEQTSNGGGGTFWPLDSLQSLANLARERDLIMHMDGARLMDAVVASGVSARDYGATCDTLWLDLSKGLGCPVGAVLAGSAGFIDAAWQWKHRLGGAMRQSGVIAAAGIYALENHVERLAEDHAKARMFAESIADIRGISVDLDSVQTNMVFFDVAGTGLSAMELSDLLLAEGIRIGASGPTRMRAVTHLDVDTDQVRQAAVALRRMLEARTKAA